ncbi:hypothetical protein GCM10011363_27520 [Marivita lacus]|uniref:Uncharacterized protein n=1 Tax=Marivita lacus TaxID=1323742 RepID=A0ABQ1KSB7_9RHOB|nr:hypothetical protein GCM10011363_27520 [Marivita lacus]
MDRSWQVESPRNGPCAKNRGTKEQDKCNLPDQSLEKHGLAGNDQSRLRACANCPANIAEHTSGEKLVHDLREIIFPDSLLSGQNEAQLRCGQLPAKRGQHELSSQRNQSRQKPSELCSDKMVNRALSIRHTPKQDQQPNGDSELKANSQDPYHALASPVLRRIGETLQNTIPHLVHGNHRCIG